MLKANMAAAVDHHSHMVRDVIYRFRLRWAALEPRWASRSTRYLLEIEVLSAAGAPCGTVHVVTHGTTTRVNLLRLVDDALEDQLREPRSSATISSSRTERGLPAAALSQLGSS
jgi:hypothetical protein